MEGTCGKVALFLSSVARDGIKHVLYTLTYGLGIVLINENYIQWKYLEQI